MIDLPDSFGTARREQAEIDEMFAQLRARIEQEDGEHKLLVLQDADLRGIDFGDKLLCRTEFTRCNFAGTTFRGNAIQNCTFTECNLERVTFDDVDLADTTFYKSKLERTKFYVDRLKNVRFLTVRFDRSVFRIKQSGSDSAVKFEHCEAAHADLKGCNLSYAQFERAKFRQCEFANAILDHARFREGCVFSDCRFDRASFQQARLDGVRLHECSLCGANLARIAVTDADLSGSDFTGARWSAASILDTTVAGANFSAPIDIIGGSGTNLRDITGAERVKYGRRFDVCSWARVRMVGSIPLFGASYLAILAIVLGAGAVEWYNHQVQTPKNSEAAFEFAWTEQLRLVSTPSDLGYMLAAILILAAGATVYRFRCQDIIKEQSETQWQYVHCYQVLVYRLHSYSRFWSRWISGVCYVVGGLWMLWHVGWRVGHALRFLW